MRYDFKIGDKVIINKIIAPMMSMISLGKIYYIKDINYYYNEQSKQNEIFGLNLDDKFYKPYCLRKIKENEIIDYEELNKNHNLDLNKLHHDWINYLNQIRIDKIKRILE